MTTEGKQPINNSTNLSYDIKLSEHYVKIIGDSGYYDLYRIQKNILDTVINKDIRYDFSTFILKNVDCSTGETMDSTVYISGFFCEQLGMLSIDMIKDDLSSTTCFTIDDTTEKLMKKAGLMIEIYPKLSNKRHKNDNSFR
jgi:hypothetical protein